MLPCVVIQNRQSESPELFRAAIQRDEFAARVSEALTCGAPAVVVLCGAGHPLLSARAQVRALHQALLPTATRLSARVSVSATDGLAAWAASTEGPVGVDVQSEVATLDWTLLDLALHPIEARWLAVQPDPEVAFTRLWAGKEAVLKAFGVGLAWSPREVEAAPTVLRPWRDVHVPALGKVWLSHLLPPANLRVAVAVALNAGHRRPRAPFSPESLA